MTDITHQDIVDRRGQILEEYDAAVDKAMKRHAKELESLAELCGAKGHVWGPRPYRLGGRHCVYCEQVEPPKP